MQTTRKTIDGRSRTRKSTQDDLASSVQKEEKIKKSVYSVSTPRNFIQKSSTADIYAKKKLDQGPKKTAATPRVVNETPMKDILRSSQSSSSVVSSKSSRNKTVDLKANQLNTSLHTTRKNTTKKLALTNVTVNSPIARRRSNLNIEESPKKITNEKKESASSKKISHQESLPSRQRTKTRTLDEDEVKILTPDAIDNNSAMQDLSRKLTAKPKAFYIDLEEDKRKDPKRMVVKQKDKSSEEDEVSYEDDFESYESDFDSYQSEGNSDRTSAHSGESNGEEDEQIIKTDDNGDITSKQVKEEEKMMDSGNFDLNESQRSASRKPAVMDFIVEGAEDTTDDKKISLDEGFQDMSSSSAVSSMRVVHTDVLERPLFIDFTKSKENKRKRKVFEKLKQRANDILSMVTLHEMSYSLFEMKPIPYDVYMVTFGRKNYTQTAVQTFEDGITEEVQTDNVTSDNKWTQFPVKFSKNVLCNKDTVNKCENKVEGFIENFNFLLNEDATHTRKTENEEYKTNPLKIFLEQKDGAGGTASLPEETYKSKLKNVVFNMNKLRKFLKKSESKISSILSLNVGNSDNLNLLKKSKYPFSDGCVNISLKNITEEKFNCLKYTKTYGVTISETKENLIMTYHKKISKSDTVIKCIICLWDISVARCEPMKFLKATDNVAIGRYRGNTNGIFIAALEDGTLHLWDLSEEPNWCSEDATLLDEKTTELIDTHKSEMSQIEKDREWNLKNSHITSINKENPKSHCTMQVSSYTSSAINMCSQNSSDTIVGLEFIGDSRNTGEDDVRKIIGQICTLQRLGIFTIWSITQNKSTIYDIGKAYWSKIKLEKHQTVHLSEYLDTPIDNSDNSFNLNAAKRRLLNRKQERIERRKNISRQKSAVSRSFDRPSSVASPRKNLSSNDTDWHSKTLCNHLKVLRLNKTNNYLVANSNGEVLCCRRSVIDFKVNRLCVTSDGSAVTRLEVTHMELPYFLAATDSGTVNLCSILEARVLLSLDCRNGPPSTIDRCQADSKGRFIASVSSQSSPNTNSSNVQNFSFSVKSLIWVPKNPFCIAALLSNSTMVAWQLTISDMHAQSALEHAAACCTSSAFNSMALITPDGEVQIHRLSDKDDRSAIELFKKYVTLL